MRIRLVALSVLLVAGACGGGDGAGADMGGDAGARDAGDADGARDLGADGTAPCPDSDGDGHTSAACGGDDCDDGDPRVHTGATEVCDPAGVDEDCDPATLGPDADGDGASYAGCCDGTTCGLDCDDHRATIGPTAVEACNGLDDDCDGMVDEGVTTTFCFDTDGDGHGDLATQRTGCGLPAGAVTTCNDCDDSDPHVYAGATEPCDGRDADCDGAPDDGCACAPPASTRACGVTAGACVAGTQTCRAAGWDATCAGATLPAVEVCNGVDDDCDGLTDEDVAYVYFADCDADGYGADATRASRCIAPVGVPPGCTHGLWAMTGGDCDDTDAARNPSGGCAPPPDGGVDAAMPCVPPIVDCDGVPGCETNLSTDATSCGACGFTCFHAGGCGGSRCLGDFLQIAAGTQDTCGLRGDGSFWCWGDNTYGQLVVAAGGATVTFPGRASGVPTTLGVVDFTVGGENMCARTTSGSVYCFGANLGDFGDGLTGPTAATAVTTITGLVDLDTGYRFTCGAYGDGTASCWGRNAEAQLGDGTRVDHFTPAPVVGLPPGIVDVSAGAISACARTAAGDVWCWGDGSYGRLGDGLSTTSMTAVQVTGLTGAVEISVGDAHACARLATGDVWCWGHGTSGQLGDGAMLDRAAPVHVTMPPAASLAAAKSHTCALTTTGDVWCWGDDSLGQLGMTGVTTSAVALRVSLTNVLQLTASGDHSCVLRTTHEVLCWGDNPRGELGIGSLTGTSTPTPIIDP